MGPTERELCPQAPATWFALTVRPNHERMAALALAGRGLESFLPLCGSRRRWSDRIKKVEVPLFPGYVFCRLGSPQRAAALSAAGVRSLVSFAGAPAAIPESEVASIQSMIRSGLPVSPWPWLQVGQRVRITGGPLRDLEGLLVESRAAANVVVSISLLQRSVAVTVERHLVEPRVWDAALCRRDGAARWVC
jgi:transcriptional antiterminator RfaH